MADIFWAGRVVERDTGTPLATVRVDLFEQANGAAIDTTTTNKFGSFSFSFSAPRLPQLFGRRALHLSYQVFDGYKLLRTTGHSFEWLPGTGNRFLRIDADIPPKQKAMSRLTIRSYGDLVSQQREILTRIAARHNGGHLFLLDPFRLLAELQVDVAPEARAEILRVYPGLSASPSTPFEMLSRSPRRQSVRFHIRSIAQPRIP